MTHLFERFASWVGMKASRASTFILAVGLVIIWAVSGPFFRFSEMWQLIINTGTTIITFLMVFLLQNATERSMVALHLKVDYLIKVSKAPNRVIGAEGLSSDELELERQNLRGSTNAPETRAGNNP